MPLSNGSTCMEGTRLLLRLPAPRLQPCLGICDQERHQRYNLLAKVWHLYIGM